MGLHSNPPNNVLVGIALALTQLVMRPVWQEINTQAYEPFQNDQISFEQGLTQAQQSISRFMLAQTNETALVTILDLAGEEQPEDIKNLDFSLLLPAFLLSELKTAFQLGFMIFVHF